MHSDPKVSSSLGAMRNAGHSYNALWDETSKCPGEGVASSLEWWLEGFTETRVEPGEATDGDLEEEGHPGLEEMHEQTYSGMTGSAGLGDGVGLGEMEARGRVVGAEAKRSRELGRRTRESVTVRRKDAGGNSTRDGACRTLH